LRARTSVWDELPLELKLMRTVLWLGLLLLPAGFFLVVFVIPTFQVVYENLGVRLPLMLRTYTSVVTAGGYLVPLIMVAALGQLWRLRANYGLSRLVAFNALFSVDQDFWEQTDARRLLTH
jgi:type II secretory pathway component PulF